MISVVDDNVFCVPFEMNSVSGGQGPICE
uniref:Uncharacterized protein n=1 Tax=Anguilla anguilla TaxID=7936 RepID=A0A0E9UPL5_ANGAN